MNLRYSRQIVCSCSGDQNLRRDRHVLHRQPAYCSMAEARTGCQAGTWRHQHARDGAAQSSGREQLAHCFFMGTDDKEKAEPITTGVDAGTHSHSIEE